MNEVLLESNMLTKNYGNVPALKNFLLSWTAIKYMGSSDVTGPVRLRF